jgi:hypothetical protein
MNTTGSHDCGNGKYSRLVWGSVEDCKLCTERKARMEKARALYAKKDVITYTDGTQGRVNQDGIIEDICEVNVLLQKEERVAV